MAETSALKSIKNSLGFNPSYQPLDVQVFPWSPLLMTGIEIIDEQHEVLVGLLNKLASHFVSGTDHTEVLQVIAALADYADYHFDTEETIWRNELPTDEFKRHQASHSKFRSQIESFQKQADDPAELTEQLLSFLTEWLAFHILESDRRLAWTVLAIRRGSSYQAARVETQTRLNSEDGKLSRIIMSLYRTMAETALTLMRSQEASSRLRSQSFEEEREELYQDLLRAQKLGKIGSWKLDLADQTLVWSPETYRLFDVSKESPLSLEDFLANVYEEDRDRVKLKWEAALQGNRYVVEHRTAKSNGERWVREVAEFGGWQEGVATKAFGTVQDITEKKLFEQKLQVLAYTNHLTGLPNRTALVDWLESHTHELIHTNGRPCLFILDMDGMNEINLRHGRDAGDEVLRSMAKRLINESEATYVAHLGSDQFALVYLECGGDSCQMFRSKRLLALIETPLTAVDSRFQMSACIGSVKIKNNTSVNAEGLLRFANMALYRAKIKGHNEYEIVDISEHEENLIKKQTFEEIRKGFERKEFSLWYQPKIDLSNGSVIGMEALIRWQHPQQGLLSPAKFIPWIEFDPLLITLGDWVIEQALAQQSVWQRQGLLVPISVNVASRQLVQPDFIGKLSATLSHYPELAPQNFEIEFLETGPLLDIDNLKRVIDQVRQLNVRTSIDDFGTGISSLRMFSYLHMQIIKIDQSFIRGMLQERADLAVVSSALALGSSLSCQVIAEGVETALEVDKLLELGCRYIQGYVVAKPMPADQVRAWLEQWKDNPPAWAPWLNNARKTGSDSC